MSRYLVRTMATLTFIVGEEYVEANSAPEAKEGAEWLSQFPPKANQMAEDMLGHIEQSHIHRIGAHDLRRETILQFVPPTRDGEKQEG